MQNEPANRPDIQDILVIFSANKVRPVMPPISTQEAQEERKLNEEAKEQVLVQEPYANKKLEIQFADEKEKEDNKYVNASKNVEPNQAVLLQANESILSPERQKEFEKEVSCKASRLGNLKDFELGKGKFENVQRVFQFLRTNKSITELYLQSNDLGQGIPKNIELLAQAIKESKSINLLHLESNGIEDRSSLNQQQHPLLEAKKMVDARR